MNRSNCNKDKSSYNKILASTLLFGIVQVINVISKAIQNKLAALILGAEGVGAYSLFQSTLELLKMLFGFGVPQSSVRDISASNTSSEPLKLSSTLHVVSRVFLVLSTLGTFFTIIFSNSLSKIVFSSDVHTSNFIFLSVAVFFGILSEGRLSILKGTRQLKSLAKISILTSLSSVFITIPIYYYYGVLGIVPALCVISFVSYFFACHATKSSYARKRASSFHEVLIKGRVMVRMGGALMFVSVLTLMQTYIIKIYINDTDGLNYVGYYQAGLTLISGYFGMIIVAMSTDYYPRVSAIHDNNKALTDALCKQTEIGLILIGPLIVVFLTFVESIISLLYSDDFLIVTNYAIYAVFGMLIYVCSNSLRLILIAKQNIKAYVLLSLLFGIYGLSVSYILYEKFGILGLGISEVISPIIYIISIQCFMFFKYKIIFSRKILYLFFSTLMFCVMAFFARFLEYSVLKVTLSSVLMLACISHSIIRISNIMNKNVFIIIYENIKNRC